MNKLALTGICRAGSRDWEIKTRPTDEQFKRIAVAGLAGARAANKIQNAGLRGCYPGEK